MRLNLVEVKSYVCPSIVTQLAQFPQTKSSTKTEVIDGQCIANAEAIVAPQHFCQPGGLWKVASGRGCECLSGYEVQNASCRGKEDLHWGDRFYFVTISAYIIIIIHQV